jgi:hypothetical protein
MLSMLPAGRKMAVGAGQQVDQVGEQHEDSRRSPMCRGGRQGARTSPLQVRTVVELST